MAPGARRAVAVRMQRFDLDDDRLRGRDARAFSLAVCLTAEAAVSFASSAEDNARR